MYREHAVPVTWSEKCPLRRHVEELNPPRPRVRKAVRLCKVGLEDDGDSVRFVLQRLPHMGIDMLKRIGHTLSVFLDGLRKDDFKVRCFDHLPVETGRVLTRVS